MCRRYLEDLRLQLLQAGVAPRYVTRLLRELEDHLHAAGALESSMATQRVGRVEHVVDAACDDTRNLTLARRWPLLTFGLGPLLTLGLGGVAYIMVSSLVVNFERRVFGSGLLPDAFLLAGEFGLPALVVLGFAWLAERRRCSLIWPALAGVVIVLCRALLMADVAAGIDIAPSTLTVGLVRPPTNSHAWISLLGRNVTLVAAVAAAAGMGYVMLRRWRADRSLMHEG